jgi:hypothetical protein
MADDIIRSGEHLLGDQSLEIARQHYPQVEAAVRNCNNDFASSAFGMGCADIVSYEEIKLKTPILNITNCPARDARRSALSDSQNSTSAEIICYVSTILLIPKITSASTLRISRPL